MAGEVRLQTVVQLIIIVRSDSLMHQIRHNANLQNVVGKQRQR
jgi:hypothetical protein